MTRYREPDKWDPETDPGLRLCREAIDAVARRLNPEPEAPKARKDSSAAPERPVEPPELSKRRQIADLIHRVRLGDLSAAGALKEMLK